MPPGQVPDSLGEPWLTFIAARKAVFEGRPAEAIELWQKINQMSNLEARHYAQAWHFLRSQDVRPPAEIERLLLGVVVEVPMQGGLDLLAAYPDHHARYYNFNGSGIIWEHPNASLDPAIDALLEAGRRIVSTIGIWEGPRPPSPPLGQMRVNVISPSGLHFGQGPTQAMAQDALAGPAFNAAAALMQQMIAQARQNPSAKP
jgi:hypothetical protein